MQRTFETDTINEMGLEEIDRGFFPRRILVIQLRQVGDAIMCTPAIRALRGAFPESRIDFLAEPPALKAVRGNPHLDHIVLLDPRDGWTATLRVISRVRGNRYDLAIDCLANPTSALIAKLGGAKYTLSYAGKRRSGFYTHTVTPAGDYSAEHKLSLLKALGIEDGNLRPEFYVSEEARERIGKWLDSVGLEAGKRFVLVDPTHRRVTRKYTRYAEVARLIKDRLGLPCVFVWGPGEDDEVRSIVAQSGGGHFLAPRTNLDELGALIGRAALLTGNDSAPRHIAAALGVPTVVPTGSTRPENWTLPPSMNDKEGEHIGSPLRNDKEGEHIGSPLRNEKEGEHTGSPLRVIHRTVNLDIECRPCSKNTCKRAEVECMTLLEPETVFREIEELLS